MDSVLVYIKEVPESSGYFGPWPLRDPIRRSLFHLRAILLFRGAKLDQVLASTRLLLWCSYTSLRKCA